MTAQLCTAHGVAFQDYPGGIVAVRASDYIASVRPSLTSGADTLASSGTFVQDSQVVAGGYNLSPTGTGLSPTQLQADWAAALDTLVIPLDDLPLEPLMAYEVLFSVRSVGQADNAHRVHEDFQWADWQSLRGGVTGTKWTSAPYLTGPPFYVPIVGANTSGGLPNARIPHYKFVHGFPGLPLTGPIQPGDVMRVRFFNVNTTGDPGLRIESLIFVPYIFSTTGGPYTTGWTWLDFGYTFGMQWNVDADGVFIIDTRPEPTGPKSRQTWYGEGGPIQSGYFREYQKATGPTDGIEPQDIELTANQGGWTTDPVADFFLTAGTLYLPPETIVDDNFARVVTDPGWGQSPQGYPWQNFVGAGTGVDGVKAVIPAGSGGNISIHLGPGDTSAGTYRGPGLLDSIDLTLVTRSWPDSTPQLDDFYSLGIGTGNATSGVACSLAWDGTHVTASLWARFGSVDPYQFAGPTIVGTNPLLKRWVKLKIEGERIRARVWDDGASEPAVWTLDQYAPASVSPFTDPTVWYPYPYDPAHVDDHTSPFRTVFNASFPEVSNTASPFGTGRRSGSPTVAFYVDRFKALVDPGSTPPKSQHLRIKQRRTPHAVPVPDLTIPYGSFYVVAAGRKQWATDADTHGYDLYTWVESGAPAIQTASLDDYFHRKVHTPTAAGIHIAKRMIF